MKLFSSSLPKFLPKIYNNNIVIKDNDEIDWDVNKQNIINSFTSFRNFLNKKETNIFVIVDKLLKENYTDSLQK
jgi:ribonucleotide monophosphatase NagD (HAD superfamily)